MAKKVLLGLVLLLSLVTVAQAGSGPDVHEGRYQITMDMEIPGMPMKMPPTTFTQCIKKQNLVPEDAQQSQECKQKDVTIKGNTVSWTVECDTPNGKMVGKGSITYNNDKMQGQMTTEGQGMKMISHFKGHRIGDCD